MKRLYVCLKSEEQKTTLKQELSKGTKIRHTKKRKKKREKVNH